MKKRLRKLRAEINREARFIDIKPYSHDIVNLALATIEENFGQEEANRAVRDYHLEDKGYREKPLAEGV